MILFTIEHLREFDLYIVIPHNRSKPCDVEYLFSNTDDAATFCDYYRYNPIAAHFGYQVREGMMV